MIVKLAGIKINGSKLTSFKKSVLKLTPFKNGLSGHTGNFKLKSTRMPADYMIGFKTTSKRPHVANKVIQAVEPDIKEVKHFAGSNIIDKTINAKLSEPMRLLHKDPGKLGLFQAVGMEAQSGIRKLSRKLNSAIGINSTDIKDGSAIRHFKNNSAVYSAGAGVAATVGAVSSFKQRKNGDQNDY